MNKELILKFKKEFDHWLHGGKILYKNEVSEAWWLDDCWSCPTEFIHAVIINDDYVELRKALAEGKTIQCRSYTTEEWIGFNKGFEPTPSYTFLTVPEYYRVKPEEPQFKVGDWVIDSRDNNLKQVVNPNSPAVLSDYIKWNPKPNEWVIPESGINGDAFIVMKYNSVALMSERCQPFIGELPTHLKD